MWTIEREIEGDPTWFQGLIAKDPPEQLHIAWTTNQSEACRFGRIEAARDTAIVLGGGKVIESCP